MFSENLCLKFKWKFKAMVALSLQGLAAVSVVVLVLTVAGSVSATEAAPTNDAATSLLPLKPVSKTDLKVMRALDQRYQTAASITMDVEKTLTLGLLGQERKAKGKLTLSGGRLHMELEGTERSLLVINKTSFWAVTFPPPEFKDAATQVITGSVATKKGRSQSLVGLLAQGGFLKFFKATGVRKLPSGESVYFLQPEREQTEFKRAQLTLSSDGKELRELRYWDERDNETRFVFGSIVFGRKKAPDSLFNYVPPANADIMKL